MNDILAVILILIGFLLLPRGFKSAFSGLDEHYSTIAKLSLKKLNETVKRRVEQS